MMICTSGSCWMTQNLQNQAVKNWILERRYSYIIRVQTSSIYIEWTTFSVLSESVKNWWRYEHLNFRSEWDQFLDLAKSRERHNNESIICPSGTKMIISGCCLRVGPGQWWAPAHPEHVLQHFWYSQYCSISINLAVTHHRHLCFARNWSLSWVMELSAEYCTISTSSSQGVTRYVSEQ